MGELISQVLPLALGSAVSPTLFGVVLLVLSSPDHPRARGAFFTLGSVAVLVVLGVIVLSLGSQTVEAPASHRNTVAGAVDLALGVILLALAIRQIVRARPPRPRKPHPGSTGVRAGHYFAFGLLFMVVNFSTLILFAAAMKDVAHADVADSSRAAVAALCVALAALPAIGPLLAYAIAPGRAANALGRLNTMVVRHQRAIAVAVLIAFGAYLTIKGATIVA